MEGAVGHRIGAVILAAGASVRLGYPKQLLQLEGRSLLQRVSLQCLQVDLQPVVVVIGAYRDLLEAELRGLPVQTVYNPDWQQGQSTSIRIGLRALSEVDAALMLVTDQLAVEASWLAGFIEYFRKNRPECLWSEYSHGATGVPLLLPRSRFGLAESLEGDGGLKKALIRSGVVCHGISLPEGEWDVDRPRDVERWKERGFDLRRKKLD